jgi:DNA-binding response OmpR family regulator
MALILLADDDELVCDVVRETLSSRGHVVGLVGNGVDAVRVVEIKRPDLIILDCTMPELPGIEALRQIRLSRNAYRTPVLILTSRRSEMDEEIAMRAGANDYLRKPFDPDQLIVRVESLLEKSASGGGD